MPSARATGRRLTIESLVISAMLMVLFTVKALLFNPPSGVVDAGLMAVGVVLLWAIVFALTAVGIEVVAGGRSTCYGVGYSQFSSGRAETDVGRAGVRSCIATLVTLGGRPKPAAYAFTAPRLTRP